MARARAAGPAPAPDSGDGIINWIQANCLVPEGQFIGRPVVLAEWQKAEIRRIYDSRARRAILSFGRKNGKTSLAAFLLLVHLCGPKFRPNSQLFSTAQSREQAAVVFNLAAKMVRMNPHLHSGIAIRDTAKELLWPEQGVRYRALSADATTAYGLSPVFVVHDELGQVRGSRSELYEALETATAAQERPLSVIISTQAPADADLLSVLIDDALAGHDPDTVCKLYTAAQDLDPFAPETIALANPAFGTFMNRTEVLRMADDARRMPSREASYRNLVLNQRVEAVNNFVKPAQWKACGDEPQEIRGAAVYAGLDLASVADLAAFVMIARMGDGKWHVHPTFWLPAEGLEDKAREDRVPYDLWRDRGLLKVTPGNAIRYEFVAQYLFTAFGQYNIRKIGFDRWNMKHLQPWLERAGFSEALIKDRFVEFGQGTKDMSPALRDLEAEIADGRLAHGNHPVLTMCASNAVIEGREGERPDEANRKLSKKRSRGRIDGMVALAMAIGVAPIRSPVIDVSAMIV